MLSCDMLYMVYRLKCIPYSFDAVNFVQAVTLVFHILLKRNLLYVGNSLITGVV